MLLKAKRAQTHILNLKTAYDAFMANEPRPYTVAFKTEPNTGDRLYSLSKVEPIPREFSLLIGDAVNNLRSCLDHSVWAFPRIPSTIKVKNADIKFYLGENANDYKARLERIKPILRDDAIKALSGLQPYIGGAGEYFCHLADLNNLDKHKLLPTIWGSCEAHSMLPSERQWIADSQRKDPSEFIGSFMAYRVSPLKVGDVFFRVPKAEVEENMQFTLNIAFAEPEIVKGNPVIETLHAMHKMVFEIVFEFWRFGLFK